MKNPWTITGIIIVVLIGGSIMLANSAAEQNNEGVEVIRHIKGNKEASVTLVEYSDFECPACASFQPAVEGVMSQYGEQISFEYKHFPLPMHKFSQPAARAAEAAAQQGKFFEYHDLLFAGQDAWSRATVPNTYFLQYAEELGLDVELFKRHLNSSLLRDKINSDFKEAKELGLTGTPTFFLNGKKMEFDSFEAFAAQISYAIDPSSASSSGNEVDEEVIFGL